MKGRISFSAVLRFPASYGTLNKHCMFVLRSLDKVDDAILDRNLRFSIPVTRRRLWSSFGTQRTWIILDASYLHFQSLNVPQRTQTTTNIRIWIWKNKLLKWHLLPIPNQRRTLTDVVLECHCLHRPCRIDSEPDPGHSDTLDISRM